MASKYPFKRDFYEDVVKSISENGATFVLGPRKCGRTVCLMQVRDACENAEYVDFKRVTERESMDILSRIQESIENDEDLSYSEWLRYKKIEEPSEENYERFLYESPEFCKIKTMEEYLQGCLDETVISNEETSNLICGNDCDLLTAPILLEVCYATLFTLHNHVTSVTFAKDNYLKTDIGFYFEKVCKELDLDKRIQDSFVGKYSNFKKRDWQMPVADVCSRQLHLP